MLKKLTAAVLAAGLAFSAGGAFAKNEISRSIPVTEDFYVYEMKAQGTFYIMRYMLTFDTGEIEFCGAGLVIDGQFRSIVRKILRSSNLQINGQAVIKDFRYFESVKSRKKFIGSPANCVSTGIKYDPNAEYDFSFGSEGSTTYYY